VDAFRAYRFRIYPSKELGARLVETFRLCAELYNAALEQRRFSYGSGRSITYRMQQNELPGLRAAVPEFKRIHSQVMQDVLRRLDRAFANYFVRVERRKTDERIKAGYPRFKSTSSYSSITYPQAGNGWKDLGNGHFWLSKFGEVRTFRHRPMRGTPKTLTIKCDRVGDWFVVIICKIQTAEHIPEQREKAILGVDLGLKNLVATSTGEFVEAPKLYRRAEGRLQTLQRALDRKQKGSRNFARAKLRLAKAHRKIERQRDDFLHKLSSAIVSRADVLVFEDLKPGAMVKNRRLAKSILDASWGKLLRYTSYKASSAGRMVELVPPRGTSVNCSRCGTVVVKSLSERVHKCPACNLVVDRDLNAAINIRNKVGGGTAHFTPVEMGSLLLTKQVSSVKQEARGYPWEDVTLWTLVS
jgi:putative transposase